MQMDRTPERARPFHHCRIKMRMRDRDRVQATQAFYCGNRRSIERGDAIPKHVALFGAQQQLLLRTEKGNVLWDCIATLDAATIAAIKGLGGLHAIAISHPHFYTTMVEWARAFGCPIHLHAADKAWIMRSDPAIKLWDGETYQLWDGVTLVRCGGHFEGGTVVHWAQGSGGRGVVCAGDILTVATDRKWLSFMRSYPNFIPLSARAVERIGAAMAPLSFDVLYGHYFDRVIAKDAKQVLEKSVARYLRAINGTRGY